MHHIVRFAEMICVTGAALRMTWHHFFMARAILWYQVGTSALNFPCLRKSLRTASILMMSSFKMEEVWQNCFVFKLADRKLGRQMDRQIDRWI